MRFALIAVLLLARPAAAQNEPLRFELGARYWLSSGTTQHSHNAQGVVPSLGNPTSVLTYENLDANVFELHGRLSERSWFLKGMVGGGRIKSGSFDDEDFNRGQVKFSDTTSSVTDGNVTYGSIDFGGTVFRHSRKTLRIDMFAGYSQWSEFVDAYGATFTVGGNGNDIPASVKVISNEATWSALRVGAGIDWAFAPRARLVADLALVPWARVRNEDSHHLRTSPNDLGPTPNIIIEGTGYGLQFDVEGRYAVSTNVEIGAGLRYWYLRATDGERKAAGTTVPLVELWSERAGLTFTLLARF